MKIDKTGRPRYSVSEKYNIFQSTFYKCYYCGCSLNFDTYPNPEYGVIDHYTPLRLGGTNDFNNLVPSCFKCNSIKRDQTINEFRIAVAKKTKEYKAYDLLLQAMSFFEFSNKSELLKSVEEAKLAVPETIFYGELSA